MQKKNLTTPTKDSTPFMLKSQSSLESEPSSQASAYAPPSLESEQANVKPAFNPIEHTKLEIAKNQKDLSDITTAFEGNKKTLADLENQYNNPQIQPELKNQLAEQYNKTLADTKQTENAYKEAFDRSAKLEVRRKALLAPSEARKEVSTDAVDGFVNAVKRGYSQGEVVDIISKGGQPTKEDLVAIANSNKEQQALPDSKPYKDFKDAKTVSDQFSELAKNPFEIISQLSAESMATMYRHAIKKVGASTVEGAVIGSVIPGAGTVAGAGAGFMAGMTLAGMNMEVAGSIMDSFKDAGVDVNNAYSLQEAFKNKELMDDAKAHAYKRAVPIALFDMVSMGIAGKVLGTGAKTIGKKLLKGGVEVGEQMALAGAGESAAQLIADKKLKPTEIMAEMLGEVGGGAPEIAVGTMVELKKQGKSIFDLSAKMDLPKEQFNEMVDVSEGSGDINAQQSDEMKAEYAATQKAKSSIPVEYQGSVPLIDAIAKKQRLEEELQKHQEASVGLDDSFKGVTEEKTNAIQGQIDELNKNIQEQLKGEAEAIQEQPKVEDVAPAVENVNTPEVVIDLQDEMNKKAEGFIAEDSSPDSETEPINPEQGTKVNKDLTEEAKLNQGRTALDVAQELGFSPEEGEMTDFVADYSENPFEIVDEYNRVLEEEKKAETEKQGADLAQYVKDSGVKITTADFIRSMGKAFLSPFIIKNFIDDNAKSYDLLAQDASDETSGLGREVDENEIPQAMVDAEFKSAEVGYGIKEKLKDRYKAVTGRKLTPRELDRASKKGTKEAITDYEKYMEGLSAENDLAEKTEKQRSVADTVRGLKIDLSKMSDGGMQMNILGIPVFLYNAAVETVALAVDGGMTLAQAIDKAIIEHKLNKVKEFERDAFINNLEDKVGQHVVGVHKKEQQRLRDKYKLESQTDYEKFQFESLNKTAEEIFKNDPGKAQEILNKDLSKDAVSPLDVAILKQYIAALVAKIEQGSTPELIRELQKAVNTASQIGTKFGQDLASMRGLVVAENSLADFLLLAQDALGVADLSDEEIKEQERLHKEFTEAQKNVESEYDSTSKKVFSNPAKAEFDRLVKENDALKKKIAEYQKGKDKTKHTREAKKQADNFRNWAKGKKESFTFKDKDGNDIITDDVTANGLTKDAFIEIIAKAIEATGVLKDRVANAIEQVKDSEWYNKLDGGDKKAFEGVIEAAIKDQENANYNDLLEKAKAGIAKDGLNPKNAKYIKGLVADLVEKGERDLDAIAEKIVTDLGARVPKHEIIAVIGGKYADKKTKTQKQIELSRLRQYASLVDKYNKLVKGETIEKVANTRTAAERQEIDSIKKSIAQLEKDLGITDRVKTDNAIKSAEKAIEDIIDKISKGELESKKQGETVETPELKAQRELLKAARKELKDARDKAGITDRDSLIRRAKNASERADEIHDEIVNGIFTAKERKNLLTDPEVVKKFPKEVAALREALRKRRDAKIEQMHALNKYKLKNRTKIRKGIDVAKKVINTVAKARATLDASFMGVHAYYVLATNPKLWGTGFLSGAKKALSKQGFDDYINDLKADEDKWEEYKEVDLEVLDYAAIKEGEAEGILRRTYFDEHKVGDKTINAGKYLGTEIADRAFIAMGNIVRVGLYDLHTQALRDQGMTYQSHPKEFKSVAKYVNNITGRAKAGKMLQNELVNFAIWSPAKLAARMNAIGVGDAFSAIQGEEGYYKSMDKRTRAIARRNALKIMGVGLGTMAALWLMGGDVDTDDESPTFGWVTFPGGFQWNVFGEEKQLIQALLNIATKKYDQAPLRFLRGKVNPVVGSALDLYTGKTFMGENVYDVNDEIKNSWLINQVVPMAPKNIYEDLMRDPITGSALIFPNLVGLPIHDEKAYIELMVAIANEKYDIENEIGMTDETLAKKDKEKEDKEIRKEKIDIKKENMMLKYPDISNKLK